MAYEIIKESVVTIGKKSNLNSLLSALAQELEELRTKFSEMENLGNIDVCSGVQLDRIGQLVSLSRKEAGEMIGSRELADNDDVYRIVLKYKAYTNSSKGTEQEIIDATKIIFSATQVRYSESTAVPATFYLSISAPFTDMVLSILGTHNLIVRPSGVRIRTSCSTSDTFTFGFSDVNPNVAGFGKGKFAQSVI